MLNKKDKKQEEHGLKEPKIYAKIFETISIWITYVYAFIFASEARVRICTCT